MNFLPGISKWQNRPIKTDWPWETYNATLGFFDSLLKMLHPFHAIYHRRTLAGAGSSPTGRKYHDTTDAKAKQVDEKLIAGIEKVKEIIAGVRTVRLQKNIPNKEPLQLQIIGDHQADFDAVIAKLCNLENIEKLTEKSANAVSFLIGTTEYALPMGSLINVEEEIRKMEDEIVYLEGFLQSVIKNWATNVLYKMPNPK